MHCTGWRTHYAASLCSARPYNRLRTIIYACNLLRNTYAVNSETSFTTQHNHGIIAIGRVQKPYPFDYSQQPGVAQMVACLNGVQEAPSSNLGTRTKTSKAGSLENTMFSGLLRNVAKHLVAAMRLIISRPCATLSFDLCKLPYRSACRQSAPTSSAQC